MSRTSSCEGKAPERRTRNVDREQVRSHFDARHVGAGHEFARPAPPRAHVEAENRSRDDLRRRVVRAFGGAGQRGRHAAPTIAFDGIGGAASRTPREASASRRDGQPAPSVNTKGIADKVVSGSVVFLPKAAQSGRASGEGLGMRSRAASLAFDYAVGICSVWICGRVFPRRVGARPRAGRKLFYALSRRFLLRHARGCWSRRQLRAAQSPRAATAGRDSVPPPYRLSLLGIPIFIAAGFGDLLWHLLLGVEEGIDALLSPTHQALGLGIFFVASGPIRSVLANRALDDAWHANSRWCWVSHAG